MARSGVTALPLSCTGPLRVRGLAPLTATDRARKSVVIATTSFSVGSHGAGDAALTVNPAGRRLLGAGHGRLAATVTATLGGAPGDTVTSALALHG